MFKNLTAYIQKEIIFTISFYKTQAPLDHYTPSIQSATNINHE